MVDTGMGGWLTSRTGERSAKDGGGGGGGSSVVTSSDGGGGGSGRVTVSTSRISNSGDFSLRTIMRVATNTAKRMVVVAMPRMMDFNFIEWEMGIWK